VTGAPGTQAGPARGRRLIRRPLALAALTFLVALLVSVLAAPLIAPYSPTAQDLHHVFAGPGGAHLLGTDNLGRDVLSRLLYGGRVSFAGAGEAVATFLVLGAPAGLAAGYLGGWPEAAVVRLADVVLAIPVIITLLVVLSVFGTDEPAAMVTLGVLSAPGLMRVVRGASLAIRPELYLTAARVTGLSHAQVLRRHVLPRVTGPVIVQASLFAGVALLTETGLGFLGLGVQDPAPSWGGMVADASGVISQDPWLLLPSGGLIGLTVLAFGLVGDAARDLSQHAPDARPGRRASAGPASNRSAAAFSSSNGALLAVRDLSVSFTSATGDTTVVDDISFDIEPGESVGLVGESGSGKTVTAWAILGLLPGGGRVSAGSCRWSGRELVGLPRRDYEKIRGSQIAMISQETIASLDPNFTIGSQIRQVVRRHQRVSRAEARRRAVDLLERVDIPDPAGTAGRYPHELSGGMAQRACIASALAAGPQLLIADEPTAALDVTVQADILDLLRGLQRDSGMAVLLVTHDWGVVADLCQRAVVMYAGQVVESTTVPRMFAQPLHPYTSALLRSNPHAAPAGDLLPFIPGAAPAASNWPSGCRFHPRCTFATPECGQAPVALGEPQPGRLSRCLHSDQLLGDTPND
jgi:peptide/nickel transport system permease protein